MKRAISSSRRSTSGCDSRNRITSGSRPVRRRSAGSQYGLGSVRASNLVSLLDPFADQLPQFVHAHACRIDDQISGIGHGLQEPAFRADRFTQADAIAAEGVLATRLAIAIEQYVVVGVQKQHFARDAGSPELLHQHRHRCDLAGSITRVEPDSDARVGGLGTAHGMRDEWLEERGRNVIDAIEVEVLEHVQRHALSGSGQTADDDQAHGRCSNLYDKRVFWTSSA
jgi:hypothetical protein